VQRRRRGGTNVSSREKSRGNRVKRANKAIVSCFGVSAAEAVLTAPKGKKQKKKKKKKNKGRRSGVKKWGTVAGSMSHRGAECARNGGGGGGGG